VGNVSYTLNKTSQDQNQIDQPRCDGRSDKHITGIQLQHLRPYRKAAGALSEAVLEVLRALVRARRIEQAEQHQAAGNQRQHAQSKSCPVDGAVLAEFRGVETLFVAALRELDFGGMILHFEVGRGEWRVGILMRRHFFCKKKKMMEREPRDVGRVRLDTLTRRSSTLSGGLAVDAHAAQGRLK
jgi:hypothetical protein